MAAAAGIPPVPLEVQAGPGLAFVPVTDNTVVARGKTTTMRIPFGIGGSAQGFVISLPTTGAEVARVEGSALALKDLPGFNAQADLIPSSASPSRSSRSTPRCRTPSGSGRRRWRAGD